MQRVRLDLQQRLAGPSLATAARARTELYRSRNLPNAREAFQLYLESFQKNRRAAYPQCIAQRNYFRISVDYVDSLEELRQTEVAILGLLLVDGLDEPAGPTGGQRFQQRGQLRQQNKLTDPLRG